MINFKLIYKVIGALLFQETFLLGLCMAMALCYGEEDALPFMGSIVVTAFFGFMFKYFGRNAVNRLSRRDSYLLVTLIWVVFSLFGSLPFMLGGYINNFTDAFF